MSDDSFLWLPSSLVKVDCQMGRSQRGCAILPEAYYYQGITVWGFTAMVAVLGVDDANFQMYNPYIISSSSFRAAASFKRPSRSTSSILFLSAMIRAVRTRNKSL